MVHTCWHSQPIVASFLFALGFAQEKRVKCRRGPQTVLRVTEEILERVPTVIWPSLLFWVWSYFRER